MAPSSGLRVCIVALTSRGHFRAEWYPTRFAIILNHKIRPPRCGRPARGSRPGKEPEHSASRSSLPLDGRKCGWSMRQDREMLKVFLLQHPHSFTPRGVRTTRRGYAPIWPVALPGPFGSLNVLLTAIVGTFGALCFLSARESVGVRNNGTKFTESSMAFSSQCDQDSVWVIRHGEKTPFAAPGSREVLELNATGWRRAYYLRDLVSNGAWPRFSHVFASSPVPAGAALREWQTVEPLATALGLPVDLAFSANETEAIARAAIEAARTGTCGSTVLIAWEHCRIPSLLMAMGCERDDCVRCWPDGMYDTVVSLDLNDEGPPSVRGVRLQREAFAPDVLGYRDYQCGADQQHRAYSRCQFADGTWL